ncbi:MAG: winged helix-turn-helix domain-containing protein [Candidatus Thermoplasmatota archaeon]
MVNVIEEMGFNAGKVWETLFKHGPLSETKLKNNTLLNDVQLRSAIGWLARENKICCNGSVFKLGETNLTGKVGNDAGKIWNTLASVRKEIDVSTVAKLAKIDVNDAYTALGWLAREDKINIKLVPKSKENLITISLKQ